MADPRIELRARIPSGYRWPIHVGLLVIQVALIVALCLSRLRDVRPWQWLAFAAALVLANAGEYFIHRGPFHVPMATRATYRRHTLVHHTFFTFDRMQLDSPRDLKWVLFPAWGLLAVLLPMSPVFVALLSWGPANLAWLYLLALTVYYAVYETFHTLSHLPPDLPIARSSLVRAVTHHHRVHHDPRLMTRFNFNFALPLFDWILGTRYRAGSEGAR